MEDKIKELKKELSKLSGVDFFNPKFRDVFKRYFEATDKAEGEEDAKEVKAEDAVADNAETAKAEEVVADIAEDKEESVDGENPDYEETDKAEPEREDASEDDKKADGEVEKVDGEAPVAKQEKTAEEKALEKYGITDNNETEDNSEATEETESEEVAAEEEINPTDIGDELLATKLELELVKAGVREDRIEVAKRLFLPEVKANGDVGRVKELIAQYPEWVGTRGRAAAFGMPIGDKSDGLTAEERRLKQAYGIDPK